MAILNTALMLALVIFSISFLNKMGSQKEYLLRLGLMIMGVVAATLLGSKLALMFRVEPLSEGIVTVCKTVLPYSQVFVIFVLGTKLFKDTKFLSCRKVNKHGVGPNAVTR